MIRRVVRIFFASLPPIYTVIQLIPVAGFFLEMKYLNLILWNRTGISSYPRHFVGTTRFGVGPEVYDLEAMKQNTGGEK